jgi:DNA-binding response OmpR family regulator
MKTRVLLIDGKPLIGEQLCKRLERQDYDVRWARDGQAAVGNADFRQADLLLIDLDVPPAESLEILSRISELNPLLPVVGLTERTDLPAAVFGPGLSAVVEKPIDLGGLLRVVEELLTQAPKERGGFCLVPRKGTELQDNLRRRPAEPDVCPAAYSGWGINE